ncbi:hypothetical protein R3P38DRAFT_3519288 [Favolaschia claudopus]|uniref:Uncharacterized protein n=1 Tax=Favolaschia claudopus TaxID=2862362 RepID=A0AAW0BQC9_9AGAR
MNPGVSRQTDDRRRQSMPSSTFLPSTTTIDDAFVPQPLTTTSPPACTPLRSATSLPPAATDSFRHDSARSRQPPPNNYLKSLSHSCVLPPRPPAFMPHYHDSSTLLIIILPRLLTPPAHPTRLLRFLRVDALPQPRVKRPRAASKTLCPTPIPGFPRRNRKIQGCAFIYSFSFLLLNTLLFPTHLPSSLSFLTSPLPITPPHDLVISARLRHSAPPHEFGMLRAPPTLTHPDSKPSAMLRLSPDARHRILSFDIDATCLHPPPLPPALPPRFFRTPRPRSYYHDHLKMRNRVSDPQNRRWRPQHMQYTCHRLAAPSTISPALSRRSPRPPAALLLRRLQDSPSSNVHPLFLLIVGFDVTAMATHRTVKKSVFTNAIIVSTPAPHRMFYPFLPALRDARLTLPTDHSSVHQ